MRIMNEMRLDFPAIPENEAFARLAVSGFMLPLDPTMEELADVKTALATPAGTTNLRLFLSS